MNIAHTYTHTHTFVAPDVPNYPVAIYASCEILW